MQLIWIARADLPEEMVYTMLKAIYKHLDIVEATWPQLSEGMKPEYVKNLIGVAPLHEGTIKYYKEIGVEIGENALRVE